MAHSTWAHGACAGRGFRCGKAPPQPRQRKFAARKAAPNAAHKGPYNQAVTARNRAPFPPIRPGLAIRGGTCNPCKINDLATRSGGKKAKNRIPSPARIPARNCPQNPHQKTSFFESEKRPSVVVVGARQTGKTARAKAVPWGRRGDIAGSNRRCVGIAQSASAFTPSLPPARSQLIPAPLGAPRAIPLPDWAEPL